MFRWSLKFIETRINFQGHFFFYKFQEIQDVYQDCQSVKETNDNCEVGGISIEQVKKFMETEDQFDKKLYQEKIKMQHKVS